jgi:hypothetical protein
MQDGFGKGMLAGLNDMFIAGSHPRESAKFRRRALNRWAPARGRRRSVRKRNRRRLMAQPGG